jgi:hypothetical protein
MEALIINLSIHIVLLMPIIISAKAGTFRSPRKSRKSFDPISSALDSHVSGTVFR